MRPRRSPRWLSSLCASALCVASACSDASMVVKPIDETPSPANNTANNTANNASNNALNNASNNLNRPDLGLDLGEADSGVDVKPQCLTRERYFVREVHAKVTGPMCQGCHNPQGVAGASELVLHDPDGYSDHVERNIESLTFVATQRVQRHNFQSKLLLTPTMVLPHPGGKIFDEASPAYAILQEFVRRAEGPDPCASPQDDDFFQGLAPSSRELLARRVALSLAGRLPTDQELASASTDEAALEAFIDALMREEPFYERVREVFNDVLLTDMYLRSNPEGLLDANHYPQRAWFEAIPDQAERNRMRSRTRFGLTREPLELIVHILKTDQPLTRVLTADHIMVNPYSARSYGVLDQVTFQDPESQDEFVPVKLPKTSNAIHQGEHFPHAGVLTSAMYLGRYPSTATNRNRNRARAFYQHFLATDVLEIAPRGGDPTEVADTFNPILNSAQCNVCHYVVDPVAGAFQNFDNTGRYRPPANGWFTDSYPPGFGAKHMTLSDSQTALRWLGQEAIQDRRFPLAMVGHAYYMLLGRYPMAMPRDPQDPGFEGAMRAYEVQRAWLKAVAQRFVQDNYSFKLVLKDIIRSPYYRAQALLRDEAPSPQRLHELKELGIARLLSPTQLDRKLTSIFGEPWRIGNTNVLRDTSYFRFLYGDIDSDSVTERLTEPNGLMGGIIRFMANDVPCRQTAKDLNRPPEQRLLFADVSVEDTPEDPQAAARIRQTLQQLHWRVLGERVAPGHPELERSFALFSAVQSQGQAAIDAKTLSASLDAACRSGALREDPKHTVRAWMAVLTYMLQDYAMLYE